MIFDEIKSQIENGRRFDVNIRECESHISDYYRLKDERNLARTEERSINPEDGLKISSHWLEVSNLGLSLLKNTSIDLELLSWLAESRLRIEGFSALTDIYKIITYSVRKRFDDLHSVGSDTIEEKISPLAGLNGTGAEGTLIQPIRLTSLIPGERFGNVTLWDHQRGLRPDGAEIRERVEKAATEAGTHALSAHLAEVMACIEAFEDMNAALSEKCGDAAPSSSNTRNVLLDFAAALRALGARDAETEDQVPAGINGSLDGAPAQEAGPAHPPLSVSADAIRSRDEALEVLLTVARYFKRTEPHSPISLAIETLVRRGRMDFSELLAELLPEQQSRHSVLTAAGIKPQQQPE